MSQQIAYCQAKSYLWVSLLALIGYIFCSQVLAWYYLAYYTVAENTSMLGALSSCGAVGLALSLLINLRVSLRLGPYVTLIVLQTLLGLLWMYPLSGFPLNDSMVLIFRAIQGLCDGLLFIVIENTVVLLFPDHPGFSMGAYLSALYFTQSLAPFGGYFLVENPSSLPVISMIFIGFITSYYFSYVPPLLMSQEQESQWSFIDMNIFWRSWPGSYLCVLSGALLSLWTSFLGVLSLHYAEQSVDFISGLFLVGGVAGQGVLMLTKTPVQSRKVLSTLVLSAILICLFFLFSTTVSPALFLLFAFVLGLCFYPLYGFGVALGIVSCEKSQWAQANKTFLSSYTFAAILSPYTVSSVIPLSHLSLIIITLFLLLISACILFVSFRSFKSLEPDLH